VAVITRTLSDSFQVVVSGSYVPHVRVVVPKRTSGVEVFAESNVKSAMFAPPVVATAVTVEILNDVNAYEDVAEAAKAAAAIVITAKYFFICFSFLEFTAAADSPF
jgi:hypothetical protein